MKAADTLETFGPKPDLLSAERMAEPRKPLSVWWGVAAAIPLLALNIGVWIGVVMAVTAGVRFVIALLH